MRESVRRVEPLWVLLIVALLALWVNCESGGGDTRKIVACPVVPAPAD